MRRSRSGRIAAGSAWTSVRAVSPVARVEALLPEPRAGLRVVLRPQADDPSADLGLQRARRPQGHDPARVDERYPVRHLRLLHVVGREEDRPARVGQPATWAQKTLRASTSRPSVASSRKSTWGSVTRARASSSLRRCPPESCRARPVRDVGDAELGEDLRGAPARPAEREPVEEPHQHQVVPAA